MESFEENIDPLVYLTCGHIHIKRESVNEDIKELLAAFTSVSQYT
jgi:hypothetical protein